MKWSSILGMTIVVALMACKPPGDPGASSADPRTYRITCYSGGLSIFDGCTHDYISVRSGRGIFFTDERTNRDMIITGDCIVDKGAVCPRLALYPYEEPLKKE